jgi:cyclic-di-GMP-binding protein
MSALFQRLVRDLPERHAAGKNSFATDGKSLRAWISHLPLANPGATARLLIGGLREMNQLRIDPLQRLEALEVLRQPVDQIIVTLDKQVLGDSFPLPPQKHQLGQLAQEFERELAQGYGAVVYDLCAPAGAVPFMRGKAAALALTRAIQHRGAYLYQAYLLYHAPPTGAWQNLHDLFQFAVAVQADDKAFEDALCGGAQISARMAYIHALLFALSNPYRFTQKENGDIYDLTRIWASRCELREGRAPAGAIAIRTDSDQSLGYLPEEREIPGEGLWALEISGLLRFLQGQLAMLPPGISSTEFRLRGGSTAHAEVSFVERLMHSWENGSERSQQRLAAGHQLDTVIGLHDVHFVLAGNQDFDSFLRKTRGVAISLHENDRVASWASNPAGGAPIKIKHLNAKVIDQSLGGYRVVWEKIEGMRVRVGELLGLAPLADDGDAQDWMIGTIRWLRIEPSGVMDAGIELLSRRALPVGLRSFDAQNVPRSAMRGVLLEALQANEDGTQRHSILAPHLFDRDASEIELTRPGDPFNWPPEAVVETLRNVRVSENGGGYLRVDIPGKPDANTAGSSTSAANDNWGSHRGATVLGKI